jgi:hypothetical protein
MIEINAIAKIEKIFDEKSVNNSKVVNILINDGTRRDCYHCGIKR